MTSSTPIDILSRLAMDVHENVRRSAAENRATPLCVVSTVDSNKNEGVRRHRSRPHDATYSTHSIEATRAAHVLGEQGGRQ